ncbi:MAG: cell division protein FtsZ [Kiritimatiellales bacterium]
MNSDRKKILILGLGGAGCNAVARIATEAPAGMEFAVMDCDEQTLQNCHYVENKLQAGRELTGGLSAGGDIEIGRRCVEGSGEQFKSLINTAGFLMVITGLGGGFGTGAAPVVARMARDLGAVTLFFAVLPFPFEGTVARGKAERAIRRMRTYADAIIELPNEQLQPPDDASVEESFDYSSRLLAAGVSGIWRMLSYAGVCNLDFASLGTMLNYCDAFCRFAGASAAGENRAGDVVEELRAHPLLHNTAVFQSAPGMIIGITGGHDLKLVEIQQIVDGLAPENPECWLKTGIAIDPQFSGRVDVMLLAAEAWKEPLIDDGHGGRKPAAGQGELGLKPRSRTFGGAERTIWKGEDLDIPTYIRRKIKLPR